MNNANASSSYSMLETLTESTFERKNPSKEHHEDFINSQNECE